MKNYHIEGSILQIQTNNELIQVDLSKPDEENFKTIYTVRKNTDSKSGDLAVWMTCFIVLGIILFSLASNALLVFLFFIAILGAGLGVFVAWKNYNTEQKEEEVHHEVFGKRIYQILKEVHTSELRLNKEKALVTKLEEEISKLSKVFNENKSSFLTPYEESAIRQNLNHLALRKELREAKVKFFEEYLKKWRIKKALHEAEETLLADARSDQISDSRPLLNIKAEQEEPREDVMLLRPLSERMELCESQEEALILLKELKELAI